MATVDYNVSAKLKKLKKQVQNYFLAGNSVEVVSSITGLSKELLTEWHDEFVVSVVKTGPARRAFLRELLLKNAPSMIITLSNLAKQKGDEKLKYSAASAILAFSARFMNEDIKMLQTEQKTAKELDNDPTFRRGLFDVADPDVTGSKKDQEAGVLFEKASTGAESLSEETLTQLLAAAERMEKAERPQVTEDDSDEEDYKGEPDLFDGIG